MGLSPFTMCVIVLVALAAIGLPIALSMIAASIFYLLAAGLGEAELGIVLDGLGARVEPSALGQTTEEWLRAVPERLGTVD